MKKQKAFRSLSLHSRYTYLRDHGKYLDSRFFSSYRVHLYEVEGFYAEVWMRTDLEQVVWIEVADPGQVVDNYAGRVDIKKDLGL